MKHRSKRVLANASVELRGTKWVLVYAKYYLETGSKHLEPLEPVGTKMYNFSASNMLTQEETARHLKELLALKCAGKLDTQEKLSSPENDRSWRDCISYDLLESYVQHRDEQIKLNTLALLVGSKKSTLRFTPKELNIIILFLRVNLKEKFEFIPLIKKALKRMKDSLAVMQRQCAGEEKFRTRYSENSDSVDFNQQLLDRSHETSKKLEKDMRAYLSTYQSLIDTCMCGPDATYSRRQASLQILLLMKDLIDDRSYAIAWTTEHAKALFNLLLLDTYESNKKMAFDLIKSIDPVLLQLDDENNIYDILTVAMELGNTIRPIDSVTAAYMLKVSVLSPILRNVLEERFNFTNWFQDVEEAVILALVLLLLKKLKESLVLAKENIVTTVTKHSLYGYLYCVRNLLHECNLRDAGKEHLWQNTISELIQVCFGFSHAVSSIVNNSSPEGHLPMDFSSQTVLELCDSSVDKQIATPQMVLLCSWRTVKEISLLFGFLAMEAPIRQDSNSIGLLNKDQIVKIGEHLVTLLVETKHRGAFEQTHVGFSQLCTRLWRSDNADLNRLPKSWLHQILITITGLTGEEAEENSKLCSTRRSAGVPFMIQALLSTEPRKYKDTKTTTFHSVMQILLGLSQLKSVDLWENVQQLIYRNTVFSEYEETIKSSRRDDDRFISENAVRLTEIKIHALNILRVIFRHSNLAEVVNDYVADGLIAAFKSYDASTWAERNAATLLFSALVIRIFGVQRTKDHINLTTDNKMNYEVFFEKYSRLLPFVLGELEKFVALNSTAIKSNVQSILLLLSRLYYHRNFQAGLESDVERKIDDLIALVVECGKSAIYETRKLAARALAALLTEHSASKVLARLVENVISAENHHPSLNLMHGYMLQILEIFKVFSSIDIDWDRFVKRTSWILTDLERDNSNPPCFLLAAVYINMCCSISNANKMCAKQHDPLLRTLVSHLVKEENLKQGPARDDYKLSVVSFIQSIRKRDASISLRVPISTYYRGLIGSGVQAVAWSAITDIWNETDNSVSVPLLDCTVNVIRDSMRHIHKYSPESQDAMFNFLYDCLTHVDRFQSSRVSKVDICKLVLNDIRLNDNKNIYRERDSYLRLLGKSYVALASFDGAEEIDEECIDDVYNNFCDNLWIVSLNRDFRSSVFQIMRELLSTRNARDKHPFVQMRWWTTVLQLLLDDHSEIRRDAFTLIQRIPVPRSPPADEFSYLSLFLTRFYECMRNEEAEFICVALFYWSVSLQEDTVYEMDETDVFDKCTSYDFFEPVEVSKGCATFLAEHSKSFLETKLSDSVIDWINAQLSVQFAKRISFRTLLKDYESYVPAFDDSLRDILDPTYKRKLLRALTYREFKKILLR